MCLMVEHWRTIRRLLCLLCHNSMQYFFRWQVLSVLTKILEKFCFRLRELYHKLKKKNPYSMGLKYMHILVWITLELLNECLTKVRPSVSLEEIWKSQVVEDLSNCQWAWKVIDFFILTNTRFQKKRKISPSPSPYHTHLNGSCG